MKKNQHGGNIWKYPDKQIIDFSANINPLGIPANIKKLLSKSLDILENYPDPDCMELRKSLQNHHEIPKENFIFGNGALEIIYNTLQLLKPKRVLLLAPSFSEYANVARLIDAKIDQLQLNASNDFQIYLDKIIPHLKNDQVMFITNPNNPTGALCQLSDMIQLIKECRKAGTRLIVDEAFIDFSFITDHDVSVIKEVIEQEHLIVIRSFTKFFACPGLRLGYAVIPNSLISKFNDYQYPWNINTLAQIVGQTMIENQNYRKETLKIIKKERLFLQSELAKLQGIRQFPSSANFLLCKLKVPINTDSHMLSEILLQQGILIRTCENFNGLDQFYFRIAVKNHAENKILIYWLKKAINL